MKFTSAPDGHARSSGSNYGGVVFKVDSTDHESDFYTFLRRILSDRIDAAKNMHRFYRLEVQPDLFGAWCLTHEWGVWAAPGKRAPSRSLIRRKRTQYSIDRAA
jgi:hypothetical protein